MRKYFTDAVIATLMFPGVCISMQQSDGERLNIFFEEVFQETLARSPIMQTELGFKDNNDKWDDISEAKLAEDLAITRRNLKSLKTEFNFEKLSHDDQLSYRLFEEQAEHAIEEYRWRYHGYPVTQMFGFHSGIPAFLISTHTIDTVDDAKGYISRLNGMKPFLEELSINIKTREAKGILPPAFVFPYIRSDIENILTGGPFDDSETDSPLLEDFRKKIAGLSLQKKVSVDLLTQAESALLDSVSPAYHSFLKIMQNQEKIAKDVKGVWSLPDGDEYYRFMLRQETTTDMTPQEIHDYGLSEVKRIHNEMHAIMKRVDFTGTLQEFFEFIRTDDQFYLPQTEESRREYIKRSEDYIKAITARLDEVFISKPKAKLEVKAVERFREQSAGLAFYQPAAIDGSRPAIFYSNLYNFRDMPTYQIETTAYHEGSPGHHMQVAINQELENLPKFRRYGYGYGAYGEGWGLYAEYLPKEMGFFTDPYQDFGRLVWELWRAVRLVTDTGLHYKKWTRQETIDYHMANTPNSIGEAVKATERYLVMPGQATSYKIGMRKIVELREKARKAMGQKFDIRVFHEVVLRDGSVSLSIMEENVNRWIGE